MPENDVLPKGKTSKEWLEYADKKKKAFEDYHGQRNIFGQLKNPGPLQDDYSKLLSDHELQARKMGMELLRKEMKEDSARKMAEYKKGGEVRSNGPATLHAGEAVARKPARKKPRTSAR